MADVAAVRSAARAAIVMPAVFALADKVIGKPQTSLFAAFGSFGLLVLVEFTGPPRTRLLAYPPQRILEGRCLPRCRHTATA